MGAPRSAPRFASSWRARRCATWVSRRANGDSGAALSPYPGAVLGEVFDPCDANDQPALGGFLALSPEERKAKGEQLDEHSGRGPRAAHSRLDDRALHHRSARPRATRTVAYGRACTRAPATLARPPVR